MTDEPACYLFHLDLRIYACSKWFKSLKGKKWPNVKEGYPLWLNHNALIICEKNSISKIKYDFVTMSLWMSKFYPCISSTKGRYYLALAALCKPSIQSLYDIRFCMSITSFFSHCECWVLPFTLVHMCRFCEQGILVGSMLWILMEIKDAGVGPVIKPPLSPTLTPGF